MSHSNSAQPSSTHITTSQRLVSACVGSLFTSLFVTPFDVVKVRLQSQASHLATLQTRGVNTPQTLHTSHSHSHSHTHAHATPQPAASAAAICRSPMDHICAKDYCPFFQPSSDLPSLAQKHGAHTPSATGVLYKNAFDAFVKIAKTEGPLALWTGLQPTLIMAIPANVLYFTAYDEMKDRLLPIVPNVTIFNQSTSLAPILAGGGARIVAAAAVAPLELVRTQMQSKVSGSSGMIVKRLAKDALSSASGFSSLWRGFIPTLWRDVPFSMIYWAGYEACKAGIVATRRTPSSTHWDVMKDSFTAGFVAGSIAAALTTPSDVVKTRMQIKDFSSADAAVAPRPTARSVFRSVIEKEGWSGLFVGVGPRVARVAPSCAIMISCYELGKKYFSQANADRQSAEEEPVLEVDAGAVIGVGDSRHAYSAPAVSSTAARRM